MKLIAVTLALLACDGSATPAVSPDDAAPPNPATPPSPDTPPQGQKALEAWLASGYYRAGGWRCETAISPPRLNGAHGRHRICTNATLLGSAGPIHPVGAASVKELFDGNDAPNGFAVGIKVAPGLSDLTWYWYERTGTSPTSRPVADGVSAQVCGPSCHAAAPVDNVYIRAP
jgi:hypothetical protein